MNRIPLIFYKLKCISRFGLAAIILMLAVGIPFVNSTPQKQELQPNPLESVETAIDRLTKGPSGQELQHLFQSLVVQKSEALPIFKRSLKSGDLWGKVYLAKFIQYCAWPEVMPELLDIARNIREHWLPRQCALYALGEIGDINAGPGILPILREPKCPEGVLQVVISTLARINYKDALAEISRFTQHNNVHIKIFANRALAGFGHQVDYQWLLSLLDNQNFVIRKDACGALAAVQGGDIEQILKSVADSDLNESVRSAAEIGILERKILKRTPAESLEILRDALSKAEYRTVPWIIKRVLKSCGPSGRSFISNQAQRGDRIGELANALLIAKEGVFSYIPQIEEAGTSPNVKILHASVPTHQTLMEKAANFSAPLAYLDIEKQRMIEGAQDEDGLNDPFYLRTRNHGYNPLYCLMTDNPTAWIGESGQPLWGTPAHDEASTRWDSMASAFINGHFEDGDGFGAWHFLGRVSHLLQDMSSPLHIFGQSHIPPLNCKFEEMWGSESADLALRIIIDGSERGTLHSNDPLPTEATLKLDIFSADRLQYRYNNSCPEKANDDVRGWIEVLAWISYFRTTFWGEIDFGTTGTTGKATTPYTFGISFDDDEVESQDNALHKMFDGEIWWIVDEADNYFQIKDRYGNVFNFMSATEEDDWNPCGWVAGQQDSSMKIGDGRYDDPGVGVVGRFWFDTRRLGIDRPCYPAYFPNGDIMPDNYSLLYYFGEYGYPLTVRYNAGLLELANRRLIVNTNTGAASIVFSRQDNHGNQPLLPIDTVGEVYYFVAKNSVGLLALEHSYGWPFCYWLKNGLIASHSPSVTINEASPSSWIPTTGDIWTAVYSDPSFQVPIANAATNVTNSGFTANWSTVNRATGYRLDVSTDSAFTNFVGVYNNLDVGNVTHKDIIGLNAGTDYYFRVRAYDLWDMSANSNIISVTTSTENDFLIITSPDGGESWLGGSSQAITWSSLGTIDSVAIEYSINGGQNWLSIITSTPNIGYYDWDVPPDPSESCLIRVRDATEPTVHDISDSAFSIFSIPHGPPQWARQYGGVNEEWPSAIRETSDGGFIIVGNSNSWGGECDTYLIKLRTDGNTEWEKIYKESSSWKCAIGVEKTSDNSYLIVGTLQRPAGNWTTFILKVSETGIPIWERIIDVEETLYPVAFFKTDDNGLVIAGSGYPSDQPVPNWIMKVTPAGSPVWMKKFDLNQVSSIVSIKQANDGGIVLLGNSDIDPLGSLVLIKLSAEGEIDTESGWQRVFSPSEVSQGSSIELVATVDGGYGILGSSATGTQLWVARLTSDGQIIWQNSYLGAGLYYQPESFQETPDGGFIITGIYMSSGNKTFVTKLDSQGNFAWGKLAAFIAASEGLSIVNTSDFGYAVACCDHSVSFSGIIVMKLASNGSIGPDCNYVQDTIWNSQATSYETSEIDISIYGYPLPDTVDEELVFLNYTSSEMIYCQGTILEPVITSIDPTFGPAGTQVEVLGSSFGASTGLVLFNSESAAITSWSDTLITCTVPPLSLSGMVPVTVRTADNLTSNSVQFLYTLGGGLIVTSPNGGETWIVGTSRAITWSNSGIINNMSIDYSTNGGQTWLSVVASAPNTGNYAWTIPATPSESCLVRVSDASVTQIRDTSDAQFSIILDKPISLAKLGEWPGSRVDSLWLQGDFAYCGTGTYGSFGLDIINVNNPSAPVSTGHIETSGYSEGVCVRGSYAYFANAYSGLLIFDVSNPSIPNLIGVYDTPGFAYDVFVLGNYAYLIDQDTAFTQTGMLFILDISNPSSPLLVGSTTAGTFPDEIFISGNHAYISLDLGGLLICDISNPASPAHVGYFSMSWSDATGVFVSGNYAYLADWFYGLQILDISNPADPLLIGTYRISHLSDVFVNNRYAYLAAGDNGLRVIDVSNSTSPTLAASYDTPGTAVEVIVRDNIIYIADYTSLFILRVSDISRDDFVGTWDGQGVYYNNSDSGGWVKMASPATMIATGDLDGDGIEDIIGLWPTQGGIWVKYSSSGLWVLLSSTAVHIGAGDMNGDGREDLLGTWDGQGVFYRNSITGVWVRMASPATMVTSGDLDGDGTDDLIGIWPGQGGVWVKYSQSGTWARLSTSALDIAAGDMNGDSRDDLLGTWNGQDVYYRDSISGVWTRMASQADQVTCGHIDDDGAEDLIGIWPGQGGVWIKYSSTGAWARLSSTARDIAAGHMRPEGSMSAGAARLSLSEFPLPMGGVAAGPESVMRKRGSSVAGPGSRGFWYKQEKNLVPNESRAEQMARSLSPGPDEPGFACAEQENLFPQETPKKEKKAPIEKEIRKKQQG
jgi:hypothetical protein